MPSIAVLPSAVADQIAAGEVVERPASVVKELVENALDAGATSVDIAVEDGGRARIRVSDDGTGMDRADATLALARHATSKIRRAADLVGVGSFGFRGEALPAICSVSHLELETATRDGVGTRIVAAGGGIERVEDAARRRGTTVTIGQLFYNTPARRKFLRGARSEWRAIVDVVATVALLRRDVRFSLSHDGESVLSLPPAPSLRSRVAGLWGAATAERLLAVEDVRGTTQVSGLVERPASVGTASRRTLLVVNGRAVRDAGIVRAAETAYRSTIQGGLRPSLLLELSVPADAIDVNVHPAKAEVRFHDRWPVERVVEDAVRRALGTGESAPFVGSRGTWSTIDAGPAVDVEVLHAPPPRGALFDASVAGPAGAPAAVAADRAGAEPEAGDESAIDVPHLVQLRRTYLMFERDDAVVLVDQHSAHERVLYERFMRQLEGGEAPSQRLLFPLTLHLAPLEGEAFEANQALFARLGFDADGFGGHTLIVRAVPAPHPRFDAERCLRDTLAALAGDRQGAAAARHERLAATIACKAAIKAGDPLAPAEMRALFVALAATTLPAHDVHGRSTIVRVGWDELERRFGRR